MQFLVLTTLSAGCCKPRLFSATTGKARETDGTAMYSMRSAANTGTSLKYRLMAVSNLHDDKICQCPLMLEVHSHWSRVRKQTAAATSPSLNEELLLMKA